MKNSNTVKKEKTPIGKGTMRVVHFSIKGEGATRLIRDMWISDLPKNAVKAAMSGFNMSKELAFKLCNGKMKMTGDSREGDGTLQGEKDDTKEMFGIALDTETMVARLEKKFIDVSESIVIYKETDCKYDEYDDKEYYFKLCKNKEDERKEVIEQLEFIYQAVGKSISDLPLDKIRSLKEMQKETDEQYNKENKTPVSDNQSSSLSNKITLANIKFKMQQAELITDEFDRSVQKRNLQFLKEKLEEELVQNIVKKTQEKNSLLRVEKSEDKKEDNKTEFDINERIQSHLYAYGYYYLKPLTVEDCAKENLGSGYLLPDGTFFGGIAFPFIHNSLLYDLGELGWFKKSENKNKYKLEDDDTHPTEKEVEQEYGWIKLSGGHGFMFYPTNRNNYPKLTNAQVQFMMDYAVEVNHEDFIDFNGWNIKLTTLAKILDGTLTLDIDDVYQLHQDGYGD